MDQMNYAENTEQASELKRHKNKTKKKKSNWKTALIALLLLILWGVGAVGGYVLSSMYPSLPMTQNNGWKPFRNTPISQSWTQPPSTA